RPAAGGPGAMNLLGGYKSRHTSPQFAERGRGFNVARHVALVEGADDGDQEDANVAPKRVRIEIVKFEPQLVRADDSLVRLFGIGSTCQDLALGAVPERSPINEAGTEGQKAFLVPVVPLDFLRRLGARADDAHLAPDDVDELG